MTLQYVARKHLKVAGRPVAPGEVVPEAATWKNAQAYINNGSLAVAVEGQGEDGPAKLPERLGLALATSEGREAVARDVHDLVGRPRREVLLEVPCRPPGPRIGLLRPVSTGFHQIQLPLDICVPYPAGDSVTAKRTRQTRRSSGRLTTLCLRRMYEQNGLISLSWGYSPWLFDGRVHAHIQSATSVTTSSIGSKRSVSRDICLTGHMPSAGSS